MALSMVESLDLEKKPVVLVTGNGFDLACGLPTKYSDFFKSFVIPYVLNDNCFYKENIHHSDDIAYYLSQAMNVSLWVYYLAFCKDLDSERKYSDKLWLDIEKEIENTLNEKGFWNKIKKEYATGNRFDERTDQIETPNSEKNLKRILKNSFTIRYSDRVFRGRSFNSREFYNCLLNELKIMEQHFHLYLLNLNSLYPDYSVVRYKNFDALEVRIRNIFNDISEIKYLSFNYTKASDYDPTVCIHGTDNPIFGIGNLEHVDPNLNIFSKLYRRDEQRLDNYFRNLDIGNYNLVFYGVSFSNTDLTEYKFLVDHMHPSGRILVLYSNYDGTNHSEEVNEKASNLLGRIYNDTSREEYYVRKEEGSIIVEAIDLPLTL